MKHKNFLFLISFLLLIGCTSNQLESTQQPFFRNDSKCDSTSTIIDENGYKTYYCFKEGTVNYLKTSRKGDSILLKRHLGPNTFEKIIYKDNKVASAKLFINDKSDNLSFEENVLNFSVKDGLLNKESSFFYEFKSVNDSIYFRINSEFKYKDPIDSIKVSHWTDSYYTLRGASTLRYSMITNDKYAWHYLSENGINDSVKTIIINHTSSDSDIQHFLSVKYLSPKIYDWNREFYNRLK